MKRCKTGEYGEYNDCIPRLNLRCNLEEGSADMQDSETASYEVAYLPSLTRAVMKSLFRNVLFELQREWFPKREARWILRVAVRFGFVIENDSVTGWF